MACPAPRTANASSTSKRAVLDGSQTCDQALRFYLSDQVDIVSKRASISAAFLSLGGRTMNRHIKTLITSGVLALALIGTAIAGPFEDGQAAYMRDDYAEAVRLWGQLADQGDARAQFSIGKMYYIGQGVRRDYAQADAWYRKAADQGFAYAQFNLGVAYEDGGLGVPQDYAWPICGSTWLRRPQPTPTFAKWRSKIAIRWPPR